MVICATKMGASAKSGLPDDQAGPRLGKSRWGSSPMRIIQSRRQFLTTLSLTGAARLIAAPAALAQEGPLETTTVRLPNDHSICIAPVLVAEELLRAEGFTDVRYIDVRADLALPDLARAGLHFYLTTPLY